MAPTRSSYLIRCTAIFCAGLVVAALATVILKDHAIYDYLFLMGTTIVLAAVWTEIRDTAPETLSCWRKTWFTIKALGGREVAAPASKIMAFYGRVMLYSCAAIIFFQASRHHITDAPAPHIHTTGLFWHDFAAAPAWLAAIGTISAVVVALWQILGQRKESASRLYFEKAETVLRTAVEDFVGTTTSHGHPLNDRRHWLNFARGIGTVQELANKIETADLKDIWKRTEHYWRERTYDALNPQWESLPADYYGYTAPDERHKNIAHSPRERAPLSEASLVAVYRWIQWPKGYPDSLDREMEFTGDEIEKMETFGPRGLAKYIKTLRELMKRHDPPNNPDQKP